MVFLTMNLKLDCIIQTVELIMIINVLVIIISNSTKMIHLVYTGVCVW